MHKDDDTAFADNYAERDQARALREQARTGGLRFEAYLPGDMADWLLAQVEQGHFVDPSEAVFAILDNPPAEFIKEDGERVASGGAPER